MYLSWVLFSTQNKDGETMQAMAIMASRKLDFLAPPISKYVFENEKSLKKFRECYFYRVKSVEEIHKVTWA